LRHTTALAELGRRAPRSGGDERDGDRGERVDDIDGMAGVEAGPGQRPPRTRE
jgi:hypothetical protein